MNWLLVHSKRGCFLKLQYRSPYCFLFPNCIYSTFSTTVQFAAYSAGEMYTEGGEGKAGPMAVDSNTWSTWLMKQYVSNCTDIDDKVICWRRMLKNCVMMWQWTLSLPAFTIGMELCCSDTLLKCLLNSSMVTYVGPSDPRMASPWNRVKNTKQRCDNPESSLRLGEQVLQIICLSGSFAAETGVCHHLVASTHYRMGQHEQSLENLKKALKVVESKEGKD